MNARHYDHLKVIRLREKAGLSKAELAEALGVTQMTIYRVESGANCSTDLLVKLAVQFGVDCSTSTSTSIAGRIHRLVMWSKEMRHECDL